jgi:hypothetical protein
MKRFNSLCDFQRAPIIFRYFRKAYLIYLQEFRSSSRALRPLAVLGECSEVLENEVKL